MKFLITIILFSITFPSLAEENITFDEYKELIRESYATLYDYRPGRVFLYSSNEVLNYSPGESDKIYVCKYTSNRKEIILYSSNYSQKYYVLVENWIEPDWDTNGDLERLCEKGVGSYSKEEKRVVHLKEMMLPPFIRPAYYPQGVDTDPVQYHSFSLDKDGLVFEEWSHFNLNFKTVYDLNKPLAYARKFEYINNELVKIIEEFPEVNLNDLILTLDGVPIYVQYLGAYGTSKFLKIHSDFKKFWLENFTINP
ncbi:MAG: hypothetical protein DRQ88_00840 [Epsilonproteobacteria bacterium]|nr:MAG: hypothetical protein DRQ89_11025 [Campylobacterota bacterium]RLA68181.1 MAG: hypothetical protein DRQ88_00840 [Campylobacterota bacterium]